MKTKALLFGIVLAAAAFAAQDAVKFERAFKEGDKDTFRMSAVATTPMGAAEMNMVMSQIVKKIYENGDADIESSVSEMKITFNGMELPEGAGPGAPKPTIQRVSKSGVPVSGRSGGGMMGMDFTRYAGMMLDKPLEIGKVYPIEQKDEKNPNSKVEGTVKLDSVTEGVAKLITDLKVFSAQNQAKPMKVSLVSLIDVASSKPNKIDGTVSDLPEQGGMPIEGVKFSMTRLKN